MHRLSATPGGWNPDTEGVIFVEQTPADIIFLTAADTDIQTLAACIPSLPEDFPTLRVVNLLQLQQPLSIDTYADTVLSKAKIIILRLLGGRSYWSYGLEVIKEIAEQYSASLVILPGDDRTDPELIGHSTIPLVTVDRIWQYFTEGGIDNFCNCLLFTADICLDKNYSPLPPQKISRWGIYKPQCLLSTPTFTSHHSTVAIFFYRAHYLSGNTKPIDALCQALQAKNISPLPIYVTSLNEPDIQAEILAYLQSQNTHLIQLLLNTTSFSLAKISKSEQLAFWQSLDVPILQAIFSSSDESYWKNSSRGLTPRDVAINVALPEIDGRIITRAISFKSAQTRSETIETDIVIYEPNLDRINFVVDLVENYINLRSKPIATQKIALILANYPVRDGRIANGVGLDTPNSCIEILHALKQQGYIVSDIPVDGDELIARLNQSITNDLEGRDYRKINQSLTVDKYKAYFSILPVKVQKEIIDRWGDIDNNRSIFPISGIQVGNIFIGIQPSRGYELDPSLNYHAPDLEPTHDYLAFYYWLKREFKVNAIVHIGKHGNLEWLPGKSIALSPECYPEITLGTIPNFYPFIVNDPGEGSQAKRRSHAVIIDHLTPPMTKAELYGGLERLESLIDEYYEAQTLDPSRLKIISGRILQLVTEEKLDRDLGIDKIEINSLDAFLTVADGYLCELKEAQIRDGLHILGKCPQGRQLRDLILAIARQPSYPRMGLLKAIVADLNLDIDPFTVDITQLCDDRTRDIMRGVDRAANLSYNYHNYGDVISHLDIIATELIESILSTPLHTSPTSHTLAEIHWITSTLLPSLQNTSQEITNLIRGLRGKYVPSGASGAPTRGRPDVLPTGCNFYSVDIRAIPTPSAWEVGSKAAEAVIERYTQENGEYPQSLAISIWGTSTMRTGGEDVAQVMALLGVRPIWDGASKRVVDFEILSPRVLMRPRLDVTLRVSGFFRDGFPTVLNLLNNCINAVASQEEEKDINPLAAKVVEESRSWQLQGIEETAAKERATRRIFTSKPNTYGAGLQGLIESQNWKDDDDLAKAYLGWSSYAYQNNGEISAAPEAFSQRLQQLEIVLQNQDNREFDILDSDDFYQFQGGLTATVRALTGKNPTTYFGDNSNTADPKVRALKEEINRVYRSRAINPKWIAGMMRHGYKGAFEIAATVDFLFAYDATTHCVDDYLYQGIAEAYLFDERVRQFIREKNPWALRDMAERLLEAQQRNLWEGTSKETIEKLKLIANDAEGEIEGRS
jgi:cobaltochelatase CobN